MKFLVFNILVVGAIVYLVSDGNSEKIIENGSSQIAKIADEKPSELLRSATKKVSEIVADLPKDAEIEPSKNKRQPETSYPPVSKTAGPVRSEREVAVRKVNKVPEPDLQGSDAIKGYSPAPEGQASNKINEEKQNDSHDSFMTNSERRRDLIRLAREMELMFADKLPD